MKFGHGGGAPQEQPNRDMRRMVGKPWGDCHICSMSFPIGEMTRHHRLQKLVCSECKDNRTHQEHMENRQIPDESERFSIQPVRS